MSYNSDINCVEFFILEVKGKWRSRTMRSESNLAKLHAGAFCQLMMWHIGVPVL
jgi:hypothetical protein